MTTSWAPLPKLLFGRVDKPFLPLKNIRRTEKNKTIFDNYRNICPGDLVYLFEVTTQNNSKKWARGYVIALPKPSDFSAATITLDRLPESKVCISIIPFSHVTVMRELEISSTDEEFKGGAIIDDLYTEFSDDFSFSSSNISQNQHQQRQRKNKRPAFPINDIALAIDSVEQEILVTLRGLSAHIFTLYTKGDVNYFKKLVGVFKELGETKINIEKSFLTDHELKLAKKQAAHLITMISKYIASSNIKLENNVFKSTSKDIPGYESILARDDENGELYVTNKENFRDTLKNPAKIAINQMFYALAPNFPVLNADLTLYPLKTTKFSQAFPTHIMVDFKTINGSSHAIPKGYAGMTAYMYLRNTKRRLTEAFAIEISPNQDLLSDKLSAALFKNIPLGDIDNGRIYLVALITETVNIETTVTSNGSKNGIPNLKQIRKGVCAGAVDVSKIFSKRKGHVMTGEIHNFTMKLYASYMSEEMPPIQIKPGINPLLVMSMSIANNGWGELVDRIISGSNKGIAINPRAEQMIVTVKELKVDDFKIETTHNVVNMIPTISYNPIESEFSDRVYLRVIRVLDIKLSDKRQFVTVELRSSSRALSFSKGSNQRPQSNWQFTSTAPQEYISETIKISGLDASPNNDNDYLYFDAYVSGEFIGEGRFALRVFDQISDTGLFSKKVKNIELFSPNSTNPVGSIEIDLEYVGKNYNVDTYVDMILNWKNIFQKNIVSTDKNLIATLSKVKRSGLTTIIKYFPDLMLQLLEIFGLAADKYRILNVYGSSKETKFQDLAESAFECIVHLLDITLARQNQYQFLFDELLKKPLPKVGEFLISHMNQVFKVFEEDWNSVGRALCRISPAILQLGVVCHAESKQFRDIVETFNGYASKLLSSEDEKFVSDQLVLIEILELYHDVLTPIFNPLKLGEFVIDWTNGIGTKGLGVMEDLSTNALINQKKGKQHKLILTKLYLLTRSLRGPCFEGFAPDVRMVFYKNALNTALEVILSEKIDIEATRLALGLILGALNRSFGEEKLAEAEIDLYVFFAKLMPVLSRTFNKYFEFVTTNGLLKPKRTFTQLFPPTYPFPEFTMDSTVKDESFCEVLIELTIILIIISKVIFDYRPYLDTVLVMGDNYSDFFDGMEKFVGTGTDFANDITNPVDINKAIREMIQPSYYPGGSWLSLKAMAIDAFASYLEISLRVVTIPPPEQADKFDKQLWIDFLVSNLKVVNSKPASLEHLSLLPKKACFNITGDIRARAAKAVWLGWEKLGWEAPEEVKKCYKFETFGGYQTMLLSDDEYSVLREVLLLCMQRHDDCLEYGRKILWSLLTVAWAVTKSSYELQRETVSALYDIFINSDTYTPGSAEINNFISALKGDIIIDSEDEAYQSLTEYVTTLYEFLTTAVELKSIPEGDEFDDDRTFHKINISGYLMNVDKPELLQSFINSMYESNLEKKNYVQAALSLELLANTYHWEATSFLPACPAPRFPSQSEFKRKEALFRLMAVNFTKGGKIEQAVECYQELLDAYNKYNFDLSGLSYCHGELCKAFKALETVGRMESTYFKVSFIGYGFPDSTRGKEFIYEGLPFEHITSINYRLIKLFPGARIISNEDEANKLINETPFGKYLHAKTVTPAKISDSNRLSFMTKQYVDNKNLKTFISTRRVPGASSVTNLWTEEFTYETYLNFPTLMNRSEIKSTEVVRLSPIKNAVKSLMNKNEELSSLEFTIKKNLREGIDIQSIASSSMFSTLSRTLAGTVDSPVNGGVGQYRSFFNLESEEPDFDINVRYMKNCFNSLITLLNKLLKLHEIIIPDSFKAQHELLKTLFEKNFKNEIEELKLDITTSINLDNLLESLVSNSRNHRRRHHGNLISSSGGYDSTLYGTNTTSSFSRDDSSSVTGSTHSSGSGSQTKLSSGVGSVNSRGASGYGSKRTAINYK